MWQAPKQLERETIRAEEGALREFLKSLLVAGQLKRAVLERGRLRKSPIAQSIVDTEEESDLIGGQRLQVRHPGQCRVPGMSSPGIVPGWYRRSDHRDESRQGRQLRSIPPGFRRSRESEHPAVSKRIQRRPQPGPLLRSLRSCRKRIGERAPDSLEAEPPAGLASKKFAEARDRVGIQHRCRVAHRITDSRLAIRYAESSLSVSVRSPPSMIISPVMRSNREFLRRMTFGKQTRAS